jgi:hypothetical protein
MAISLVGTVTGGAANGADVTLTLPGGIAENDLVCVFGGFIGDGDPKPGVSTSGYTENVEGASYTFSYKKMGASPDASVTCSGNNDPSIGTFVAVAYVAMVFRGVDVSTPIDATTIVATGNDPGSPNSGSITTVTDGAAVITAGFTPTQDATITAPTGYGDTTTANATDLVPYTVGAAWKTIASAGATNPEPWSNWDGDQDWVALTVALRPAASGTFGDGAFSGGSISGTATFVGVNEGLGPFAMTGTGTASFAAQPFYNAVAAFTGTETSSWVGTSISNQPVPFSMTGTGTASFVGALQNAGVLAARGTGSAEFGSSPIYAVAVPMTGTASVFFVGAVTKLSHVREVIESKGAATVSIS